MSLANNEISMLATRLHGPALCTNIEKWHGFIGMCGSCVLNKHACKLVTIASQHGI